MSVKLKSLLAIFILGVLFTIFISIGGLPGYTFHGRVIDQYDKPVVGAKVFSIGSSVFLGEGSGMGWVETDDEGYFKLKGRGASLILADVTHPEIAPIAYPYADVLYEKYSDKIQLKSRGGQARFVGHDDPRGIDSNWHNHAKKSKAYVVRAWRIERYEGAIAGVAMHALNANGEIYTVRFTKPEISKRFVKGKHDGDMYISCTRGVPKVDQIKQDWAISMTPVDGGIIETKDLYRYIVPEDGYTPTLHIVRKTSNSNYVDKLQNRRYYFTAHNGQMYGSLFGHFEPFSSDDTCIVTLHYSVNPNGSRNLLIKPREGY